MEEKIPLFCISLPPGVDSPPGPGILGQERHNAFVVEQELFAFEENLVYDNTPSTLEKRLELVVMIGEARIVSRCRLELLSRKWRF